MSAAAAGAALYGGFHVMTSSLRQQLQMAPASAASDVDSPHHPLFNFTRAMLSPSRLSAPPVFYRDTAVAATRTENKTVTEQKVYNEILCLIAIKKYNAI